MSKEQGGGASEKTLVLVRGLPGVGKTTVSNVLASRFGEENCVCLNPDEVSVESEEYQKYVSRLEEKGVATKYHPYRFLRNKALRNLKEGNVVIWDQPWSWLEGAEITIEHLREGLTSDLDVVVIDVELDAEVAWDRVEKRVDKGGHGPSRKVFERFVERFRSGEGLTEHYFPLQGDDWDYEQINVILEEIDGRAE